MTDAYALHVPADLEPGRYGLIVALGKSELGTGPVWVAPGVSDVADLPIEGRRVTLGDSLALLGWRIERSEVSGGDDVVLTVLWNTVQRPAADYHVSCTSPVRTSDLWPNGTDRRSRGLCRPVGGNLAR